MHPRGPWRTGTNRSPGAFAPDIRKTGTGLVAVLLLATGLVAALSTPAEAGPTPDCVPYAGTVTCTADSTGSSTWTVPPGVTNVTFVVAGAQGGVGGSGNILFLASAGRRQRRPGAGFDGGDGGPVLRSGGGQHGRAGRRWLPGPERQGGRGRQSGRRDRRERVQPVRRGRRRRRRPVARHQFRIQPGDVPGGRWRRRCRRR